MTTKKAKQKPDDAKQSQQFIETARKLGVDESGKAFDRAIESVIKPTPPLRERAQKK